MKRTLNLINKKSIIGVTVILIICLITGISILRFNSFAKEKEDTCTHPVLVYMETKYSYPNADTFSHQKLTTDVYRCTSCGGKVNLMRYTNESHYINPSTNRCECGFYAPH